MTVKIYHNPRCSKSRQTLALLQENDIEPEVILYLETPPSENELKAVLKKLGLTARDIIRKSEQIYKDLNLSDQTITEAALITAMSANPILIERPIVINGKKARLGRPPEAVLEII